MPEKTSVQPLINFSVAVTLFPAISGIFIVYLVIGFALAVIPLHVHHNLGLNTFAVGIVAGSQFAATLISRFWSGNFVDQHGGKYAMKIGVSIAILAGFLYILSLHFMDEPYLSVAILFLGRATLGVAESFIISGGLVWGLAMAGSQHTGNVMSWIGSATYVAYALGAPIGIVLFPKFGFFSVALFTTFIPLLILPFLMGSSAETPKRKKRQSLVKVIKAVGLPGIGVALSSIGFGSILTFIVLLFARYNWGQAWLALSCVTMAFVLGRILFGHLPDKKGGTKVTFICIVIESIGLLLIWAATYPVIAMLGALLAGLGYSLIYPGFGVEALRRLSMVNKGIATGAYTAFLDLALGLANPVLGLIAKQAGIKSVFLISALTVLLALSIAFRIIRQHKMEAQRL